MPEYIEREALIEKISALETAGVFSSHFKNIVLKIISEQPAAEIVAKQNQSKCKNKYPTVSCQTNQKNKKESEVDTE